MTYKIYAPKASGATQCIVRWMMDTERGWVGAWDKEALQAVVDAAASERERCAQVAERETARSRRIRAMCNSAETQPCEIASAIRARGLK